MNFSKNKPCYCRSGSKLKHCHVNFHPESRAAHMLNMFENIDQVISDYQQMHGSSLQCAKGCSNCCYDYFIISEVEFEIILKHIEKTWKKSEVDKLYTKAHTSLETFKKENPDLYRTLTEKTTLPKQAMDFSKYVRPRTSFPCPFLDDTNKDCRIYPVRPMICRIHGSTHISFNNKLLDNMDEKICEHITDSQKHRKNTPNVGNIISGEGPITNIFNSQANVIYPLRKYPIFFWFTLYPVFRQTQILNKNESFLLSMEQSNKILIEENHLE